MKPDWSAGRFSTGGYIADVPKPRIYFFPHWPYKRNVKISIKRYAGAGVHYHAFIAEEDNPVWSPSRNNGKGGWTRCWDSDDGDGRQLGRRFNVVADAEAWVRETLRKKFPRSTHKYSYECGPAKKWFYREGD